ncbi:MFS transporter [Paenibacillus sacheonensis]|uniref:MFS transporter n=1 Tax=Paenibacillus sacheonensis TaxID=742054 RepID=A0A7X4YTJ6_9BACL|nr:MFS transporter [Paenibacillus sacheonensis]MBM7567633.1 EmrB/QacA subfamily drug resistance transporter [Paenibacillus sacheonensis]NBC71264.1 MFS transporter [Paenibacillus sacheonensis]
MKQASHADPAIDPRRWLSLSIVILATFMVVLDTFIVNVALPSIEEGLHADFAKLQLVVAAYVLGYAVLLVTGGRLGDLFGRKTMFLIGVAGFVAASAWCGIAGSAEMLIAARIAQGVSAAAMVPQVLSIIQVMFPAEEKGRALGIYGGVLGLGAIAGQIAGGLLLRADWWGLGWRLVFLVNIPVGIAAFVAALLLLRESRAPERKRLDFVGVGLLTIGLGLFIYPLVVGREEGWPLWTFISLVAALPVIAGFVRYENGLLRRGASPLLPMALFRDRSFRIGMIIALAFYSGNAALYLILSIFMQIGRGAEPLQSAYAFIPMGIGFFSASLLGPRLKKRWGNRVLLAGATIMAVGYLLIIAVSGGLSGLGLGELFVPLLLAGIGQGAVASPLIHTVLAGVQGPHAGAASGVLSTFTQVAQALGIAAIGTLYQSLQDHFASGGETLGEASIDTMRWSLAVIIALAALTFLLLASLGRKRRAGSSHAAGTEPAA